MVADSFATFKMGLGILLLLLGFSNFILFYFVISSLIISLLPVIAKGYWHTDNFRRRDFFN